MRHARASSCGLLECLRDAGAFAQLKTSDASHRSDAQRPGGYVGPLFMLGRVPRVVALTNRPMWGIIWLACHSTVLGHRSYEPAGLGRQAVRPFGTLVAPWGVAVRARRTVTVSHGIAIAAVGAASATHLGSSCNTDMLISARPSWLPFSCSSEVLQSSSAESTKIDCCSFLERFFAAFLPMVTVDVGALSKLRTVSQLPPFCRGVLSFVGFFVSAMGVRPWRK